MLFKETKEICMMAGDKSSFAYRLVQVQDILIKFIFNYFINIMINNMIFSVQFFNCNELLSVKELLMLIS